MVQEWGAGRGTLAATVADGLAADGSGLSAAIDWQPVDVPGRHPVVGDTPIRGAVVANEYLDALPVHRVVRRGNRLLERYVTWKDGWFAETEGEPSTAELPDTLTAAGVTLAEGQLAEVRPAASSWLMDVAARLRARHRAGHRLRPGRRRAVRSATHGGHARHLPRPCGRCGSVRGHRPAGHDDARGPDGP